MYRYLVAWLPTFRLDRCGWATDQPVVLVEEERSALRVWCATAPALSSGVRVGMTLAEACALAPDITAERRDHEGEEVDLAELSAQLLRVSPAVAPLPPTALVAEIGRGEPRTQAGSERALVERVHNRLTTLGHSSTVVVADDPDTARIVAAYGGRHRVVPRGGGAEAMAALPLAALALPEREHVMLTSLGLVTVGALAALPAASVVGRLGPLGVAAHALARGRGVAPVLAHWTDGTPLALSQDMPEPVVHLEALLFVINALLLDACTRLRAANRAATRVDLRFRLDGGGAQNLSMRLGEPTRDPKRVLALLRTRMERFQLAGPVDTLTLTLPETAPFDGRQHDLLQRRRAAEAVADVTARLQDALGSAAVSRPVLLDRHRPEAAWRAAPVDPTQMPTRPAQVSWLETGPVARPERAVPVRDDAVDELYGYPDTEPPNRPPLLLSPPVAILVRTGEGGHPMRVEIDGRGFAIHTASGPERLDGEWWDAPFLRSYWRIGLADGRWAWVYREDGHWVLHGWWDRSP
jgi:protein ImuB